jgi:glutathione synthase/RimK-type ligase-like ATP-grasp enzyme
VAPVVWTETSPNDTGCDLLVLRSVWDYHLHAQVFSDWVAAADRHATIVNSADTVRWNMDKHYLKDIENAGFPVPKTVFVDAGPDVDLKQLMEHAGFADAVIKPAISASAYETHHVNAGEAIAFNRQLQALLTRHAMLVQEFVPEIVTQGEWSLVFIGGQFTHAVSKLPQAGDFRVQHEHGGSATLTEPPEEMIGIASAVLHRFAPEAIYCRVDLVQRGREALIMELELIDPLLHFEAGLHAAERMADLLCAKLRES